VTISSRDLIHLQRAVELASAALAGGDEPFGSVLVDAEGRELFADHNHVVNGDGTQHPEFAIARWAGGNLSPAERAGSTVYTSGEHCPMCSAAHAWVGLGRIVIAASCEQTAGWAREFGAPASPVLTLPIRSVAPHVPVDGPCPELADSLRELFRAFYGR
jgi:tRNA(Arg) A34 adenosine deaminase TadA